MIFKPMTVMLPRIDDVLHDLASQNPTVYSNLDLCKRFWIKTTGNTKI